jgi:hypothetical protein
MFTTPASAASLIWTISGATFVDGGVLTGSFTYDADTSTVSDWALSVSGGDENLFPAITYTPSIGYSFALPFSPGFNFGTGNRHLRVAFDAPLTNAGGTVALVSNQYALECYNCSPGRSYATPGSITASVTSAVPEASTWALMVLGFGAVGTAVRASRRRRFVFA